MTLSYSYIKLQVWVLMEYNTYMIAAVITVLVTHHQHAYKSGLTFQTARIELVETA